MRNWLIIYLRKREKKKQKIYSVAVIGAKLRRTYNRVYYVVLIISENIHSSIDEDYLMKMEKKKNAKIQKKKKKTEE